jgi:twitching motility protein PilT
MTLTELLKAAQDRGGSDLHLSVGAPPIVRIDGDLHRLPLPPLTADLARSLACSALSEEQRRWFDERNDIDLALSVREVSCSSRGRPAAANRRRLPPSWIASTSRGPFTF